MCVVCVCVCVCGMCVCVWCVCGVRVCVCIHLFGVYSFMHVTTVLCGRPTSRYVSVCAHCVSSKGLDGFVAVHLPHQDQVVCGACR